MGYLINPVSMRIGTLNYWEDFYYKNHLYYPEYLQMILKMRLFLISFLSSELFEKNHIFYSHFYFIRQNKSLIVKIFLYCSLIENCINSFFLDSDLIFNQIVINDKHFDKSLFYSYHNILIFFFNYFFINNKIYYNWIYVLLELIKHRNQNLLIEFLLKIKSLNLSEKIHFFVLYKLILKYNYDYILFFKSYFFFIVKNMILKPQFLLIQKFIDNYLNYFCVNNINKSNTKIYLISNDNLNTKFLARFIAKKLKQGLSIKTVITPIIKDLLITGEDYLNVKDENDLNLNKKFLFKNFLFKFKSFYLIKLNKWFKLNSNFLSLDTFFLIFFLKKKVSNDKKLLFLLKQFFTNMIFFKFYYFFSKYIIFLKFDFFKYLEVIIWEFESSLNIIFEQKLYFLNENILYNSFFFLNKFLKYNFLRYNYIFNMNIIYFNKLRSRIKYINKDANILGFKFHFLGRFSRKQRASSIWYIEGKVPLNTLSANIEYSCYNIALFNSAVNVKVFLYRGNNYKEYFLQII